MLFLSTTRYLTFFQEATIPIKLADLWTVPCRLFSVVHLLFCDNRSQNQATRVAFLLTWHTYFRQQRINFIRLTAKLNNVFYFFGRIQNEVFYPFFGTNELWIYLLLIYKNTQALLQPLFACKSCERLS